jgi:hypothetical protein
LRPGTPEYEAAVLAIQIRQLVLVYHIWKTITITTNQPGWSILGIKPIGNTLMMIISS